MAPNPHVPLHALLHVVAPRQQVRRARCARIARQAEALGAGTVGAVRAVVGVAVGEEIRVDRRIADRRGQCEDEAQHRSRSGSDCFEALAEAFEPAVEPVWPIEPVAHDEPAVAFVIPWKLTRDHAREKDGEIAERRCNGKAAERDAPERGRRTATDEAVLVATGLRDDDGNEHRAQLPERIANTLDAVGVAGDGLVGGGLRDDDRRLVVIEQGEKREQQLAQQERPSPVEQDFADVACRVGPHVGIVVGAHAAPARLEAPQEHRHELLERPVVPARDLPLAADHEPEVDRIERDDVKIRKDVALLEREGVQEQALGHRHRPRTVEGDRLHRFLFDVLVVEADQMLVLEAVRKRSRLTRADRFLGDPARIPGDRRIVFGGGRWVAHRIASRRRARSHCVRRLGRGADRYLGAQRDPRLDHRCEWHEHIVAMREQILDPHQQSIDSCLVPNPGDDADQNLDVESRKLDLLLVEQRLDPVEHCAELVARNCIGRCDTIEHIALQLGDDACGERRDEIAQRLVGNAQVLAREIEQCADERTHPRLGELRQQFRHRIQRAVEHIDDRALFDALHESIETFAERPEELPHLAVR